MCFGVDQNGARRLRPFASTTYELSGLPGAVLPPDTEQAEIQIEARAARNLQRVEIVVDGEVVESFQPAAAMFMSTVRVPVQDGGWLAVRAFEEHPRTVRFAHTSPYYIGKQHLRDPDAVAYLKAWIEAEIERLQGIAEDRLTPEQKAELIAHCRKALQQWQ